MAWATPRDEKLLEPSIRQMAAAKRGFIGALHADSTPMPARPAVSCGAPALPTPPGASRLTEGERNARNRFRCRSDHADDAVLQRDRRRRTNRDITNCHLNL